MFLICGFNRVVSAVCAAVIGPLIGVSGWLALGAVSLLTALIALLVFKYGSSQSRIRRAKDIALARILEIRIYKDDLSGIFGAFGRILLATARYLSLCLFPLLVMMIPIGLMLIHMAAWFEWRPLRNGDTVLVTAAMDGESLPVLESSSGIRIETEAFVVPDQPATWRISVVDDAEPQWIAVTAEGERFVKQAHAGEAGPVYPFLDAFFPGKLANPVEPPLPPSGAVHRLKVQHPKSGRHWIAGWLVLSMAAGLILKYPLRVEI